MSPALATRHAALHYLCEVGQALAAATDLDELLHRIITACKDLCGADTASLILLDRKRRELYFKQVSGDMGEAIKRIRLPLDEHSIAGWVILHQEPLVIHDAARDPRHYKGVDKATLYETTSVLAVPIQWGGESYGCLEAINKLEGRFDATDQEYLTILAQTTAVALKNVRVKADSRNFFAHTIEILIAALETLEPAAKGHITRMARLATAIARELNLPPDQIEQIWYGAYFHDIGKLRKEVQSLNRMDRLHAVLGARMIEPITMLAPIAPLVRAHHEYYDGTGGPDGLVGEQIPLGARILSLCEDYEETMMDAAPGTEVQTREEFFGYARARHDPALVAILMRVTAFGSGGMRGEPSLPTLFDLE